MLSNKIHFNISSKAILYAALLFSLCFNLTPNYSFSQACCSGGVPLSGVLGIGLGSTDYKSLQLMLTYDYNNLSTLMDGGQILEDQIRQRTTNSTILEINYGLSKRISLTALLPYIKQSRSINSFGGSTSVTSTKGIGDGLILMKYRLLDPLKVPGVDLVIGGGIKFPTGKTNSVNEDGFILVADMQAGSGSLDGIFWFYYQQTNFMIPNLSLISVTTYKVSGTNNSYNSSQNYKFGNEFQTNLGFSYSLFARVPISLFSFFRYRTQKIDLIDGNTYSGSGGKWAYLIPGVNIDISPAFSLRVSVDLPLYRKLNGTQLTTTYKITSSLLYRFPLMKKVKLINI